VTGTAGFIGFHLARLLTNEKITVHGYDGFTDYYDIGLKNKRHEILSASPDFTSTTGMLEDEEKLSDAVESFKPHVIVHLAAQAGVRYSLENPRVYVDSNVMGTLNIMELARNNEIEHLLIASTSSVYGGNIEMPFSENQKSDSQLSIYSATKKANESMAHAYSHLWNIPTTMFRFFTVYGPWGRPDMALFKFVKSILENNPIDIYNDGKMYRDFTYVDDLVRAIRLLIEAVPQSPDIRGREYEGDSISKVAPWRVINLGNSQKVELLDFIKEIELELGIDAIKNYMPMQLGDVPATLADTTLLQTITGYKPHTDFKFGVREFVRWYREYYGV
tara:strand:+ start:769 stop:1767 length:999 start_codon:yes stop_codon:yes gene_type:complete